MNLTLREIADALGAQCVGNGDKIITSVSFDSRKCGDGTLFAALKGEKRDGHDFIEGLVGSGAAVLCSKNVQCDIDAVITDDVQKALEKLATWYKETKCNLIATIAITGSVGKTTTKDFTSCVVQSEYKTHKTQGNYNNNLGVPMTLFGIQKDDRALVCEMGMSNFGEIELLTSIAHPDIAIITNIGTSHIENLKSRENICKAKCEIVKGMKKGSTVIVNGDEPLLRGEAAKYLDGYRVVYVGLNDNNDIYAKNIISSENTEFMIQHGENSYSAKLFVAGEHNVYNALFAYAAGVECGINPHKAATALSDFRSGGMRQNTVEKNGIKLMVDCYNASRESMCAALKVLCGSAYEGHRRIAVLGEMLELGEKSIEFHRDVGSVAAQVAPDMLFTLDKAVHIGKGAVENGYPAEKHIHCADKDELSDRLSAILQEGDVVLFKASRGIRLEETINKLGFEI